jgi:sRNA-binding carbon storage regulator CsrA
MLILSRRSAQKVVIEKIVVNVLEIRGRRVRLGVALPAGQSVEVQDERENGSAEEAPEVRFIEGGHQMLVWARPGWKLRVNDGLQVQVVAVEQDRVRLGILAPPGVPVCREELDPGEGNETATPVPPAAPPGGKVLVSAEVLSAWVARKIEAHLKQRPRGALRRLAQDLGISSVSINRWRRCQSNVATNHLHPLLEALGVGLNDLAHELNVGEVEVPTFPARGPAARTEAGTL